MRIQELWRSTLFVFNITVIPTGFDTLNAQDTIEVRPPVQARDRQAELQAVRVQQQVKPAFLIQPLVHRLQARRGQLVRFEFEIESNDRPSRLEIRPVAMTQQENGVIMPDESAAAPDLIRLISLPSIDLSTADRHVITAQMRIPAVNAPFLSYGILVREIPLEDSSAPTDNQASRVGVRFVTQYLLRVDVDVLGVRGDSVAALQFSEGRLVPEKGLSLARIFVENPTDTAMEFGLDCQLVSESGTAVGKSFGLVVPVRSGQDPPDRFHCRILPGARLRVEEFVPHPIFSGRYTLDAKLTHQGRLIRRMSFPIEIQDGEFPAQDAAIVRVARDITVEPAHVELSLRKGGQRISSLSIRNDSLQTVTVDTKTVELQGTLSESLVLRPSSFQLEPGRTRKLLVSLGADRDYTEHSYAFAEVTVRPEVGESIGSHRIPIALLTNSESVPSLTAGQLRWDSSPDIAGFSVPITNSGVRHVALNAQLMLTDAFGRGMAVDAGFGKWLLPNSSDQLFFAFRQNPPPGTYQVKVRIDQGEGQPPMELSQTIQLSTQLQERVSYGSQDSSGAQNNRN